MARYNPLKPDGKKKPSKAQAPTLPAVPVPAASGPPGGSPQGPPLPPVQSGPLIPEVNENEAKNGFELRFPSPPPPHILTLLRQTRHESDREHHWHWHFVKKFWYAKRNDVTRAFLQQLIGSVTVPPTEAPPAAPAYPAQDRVVIPVDFGTAADAPTLPAPTLPAAPSVIPQWRQNLPLPDWRRRLRPGGPS